MTIIKNLIISKLFFLFIVFLLSGCSLLSPVKTDTYTTYVINTIPKCVVTKPRRHITLYIAPVVADPLYDTDQMAYSTCRYQVEYFSKNRWAEPPAKMLQPFILQTLQKTHHFHAITTLSNAIQYDYVLNTQLLELRQIFLCDSSFVVFTLRAEIINAKTGQIIATKQFTTIQAVCEFSPFGGVIAANRAVSITLGQLAYFCLKII